MEAIRVAIADDNERILELLDEIIRSDNELKLVGKADNGEDICTIIREKEPDVVLLDLIMPKMDGLSVMDTDQSRSEDTQASEFHCGNGGGTGSYYRECIQ